MKRLRHLLLGLALTSSYPALALATLPLPPYPLCGSSPDQDPSLCPSDFGEDWRFLSYVKDDYKANVREEEWAMGSGFWLDKAFSLETGDFRITIAVLDSGIEWDASDLANKHRLNQAELPLPQDSSGLAHGTYDLNGDGLFNIRDYASDPRVSPAAGDDVADTLLEPSDLIAVFSDGVDDDANGYVDDIAGWDFFWNDNNPYDTVRYGHGTGEAEDSAREGGNGGSIGTCPNCSVLNLRVGDSFVTDVNVFAEAVAYAADNGASIIQEALGTVNNSTFAMDALEYAYSKGLTVVASAADETSIHQNQPANNEGTLVVHAIRYDTEEESGAETFLAFGNCTNFGGHLDLSVSGTSCSSEATGRSSGIVGLVYSAALHRGLTLTSNEARQILTLTADDIDVEETYNDGAPQWYPSQPGWDRYFGYGRINAYKAVNMVLSQQIPPEAELHSPEWFQVLYPSRQPVIALLGRVAAKRSSRYTYTVSYGIGLDPLKAELISIGQGSSSQPISGTLAQLDLRTIPTSSLDPAARIQPLEIDDTNVERHEKVNRYTLTVVLEVVDAEGRRGEARRTLYVHDDPDLLPAFPKYVGGSLESSPRLIDLDLDGRDELIQATSDGQVYALRADGSSLSGFPVRTRRLRSLDAADLSNHVNAPAYATGRLSADRGQAIISTPAVGDITGDGRREIVAATHDGEVYAWNASGVLLKGFPVTVDYSLGCEANTSPDNYLEAGFFGSPALGDLDGDGVDDIVIGAMDSYVYAWDGSGLTLPGWPVHALWPVAEDYVLKDRIMTSPAIGDLNLDGILDVVIGTNEIIEDRYSPTYAIHGDGLLHRKGPYLRGWPVLTQGVMADILPSIGKGTQSSPALADIDGDGRLEVATHTVTGFPLPQYPSFFRSDGRPYTLLDHGQANWGILTNTDELSGFVTINSGAFGDIDQDGDLDYANALAGFNALINLMVGGTRVEHNYLMGAWDGRSGRLLPGFPQQVPDMQFFLNPAIADVSGDGMPEVLGGNGAFTVDAFDADGTIPANWPKFTGQWNIASPAVGDMDGDGGLEVVQPTRSGWIYVWHTEGLTNEAGGAVEWDSYHGGATGSGNYERLASTRERVSPSAARTSVPRGR